MKLQKLPPLQHLIKVLVHPSRLELGGRLPLTGVRIPKIRKRGFRSQRTISLHPSKGCSESKNPHFPCHALYRNGDFFTQSALFWGGRKWGSFDLCKGQTDSQGLSRLNSKDMRLKTPTMAALVQRMVSCCSSAYA